MKHPWRGLAGLPTSLWLLFTVTLINRVGTMVLAFLPLYLAESQGYTLSQVGSLLALYGAVAIAVAPLAGWLCDRFGPAAVMVFGLVGNGLALFAFPFAHGPWIVLAVVGMAATNETTRPASLAAVTAWATPESRRMAFALVRLAINLGVSVGPALGGFLAHRSYPLLFAIDGSTSLAAGLVLAVMAPRLIAERPRRALPAALPISDDAPELTEPVAAPDLAATRSPYTDRRFLSFLAIQFLVYMVFFQHSSAMAVYMVQSLGLSTAVYGLMFTVNTAIIVLLELPLNGAMAAWPLPRALALGALLCGIGFGGLGLVHTAPGVLATVIFWTFGEMIAFPTAAAFAARLASSERQGAYMGAFSMAGAAAFAIGPWAGLQIFAAWGPQALWATTFACGALAAALFWRLAEGREAGLGDS